MVNAPGPPRDTCLQWGSSQEIRLAPLKIRSDVYVGRAVIGDSVVIGNLYHRSGHFWANAEGIGISLMDGANSDVEILTKDVACPLPWMPYIAGETLPYGAVTGGRYADGSDTYVVKVMHSTGTPSWGYYHPASALAYYELWGALTASSMEILVIL